MNSSRYGMMLSDPPYTGVRGLPKTVLEGDVAGYGHLVMEATKKKLKIKEKNYFGRFSN